jgi:hypothetical protein
MELVLKHNLKVDVGDEIFYINTGTAKSHSDIKAIKDKEKGTTEIQFYCELIPQDFIENNPDFMTDNYNVAKYISALNSRIKPLLVCFDENVRDKIIIDVIKDRKTKEFKLKDRSVFAESECQLVFGKPLSPEDQDDYYEDLMKMEDREIKFWMSVNKTPNFMTNEEWIDLQNDYIERMRVQREKGIADELERVLDAIKRMEVVDFKKLKLYNKLPDTLKGVIDINDVDGVFYLTSIKWGVNLYPFNIIFDYEQEAINRAAWYSTIENNDNIDDMYDMWLNYIAERKVLSGDSTNYEEVENDENTHTSLNGLAIINNVDKEVDLHNDEDDDDWGF